MQHFSGYLAIAVMLIAGACAKPAKVVLYDQRNPGKVTSADRSSGTRRVYPSAPGRGSVSVAPLAGRPDKAKTTAARQAARKQYQPIPKDGYHRVAAKETVYAISRLYGVPVRGLITANRLEAPYGLQIGQRVRLPTQRKHVVVKGETVYGIARHYGISLKELVSLNGIAKPFVVKIGETLLLPDSDTPDEPTEFAQDGGSAGGPALAPKSRETRVRQAETAGIRRVVVIPRPERLTRKGFLWPVRGRVVSRFGAKGKGLYNDGINIAAKRGAPVRAAENGVVVYRGNELRGFGNLVLIKHANGYMSAYGHNSVLLVKRGQKVRRGEIIAKVGSTGNVDRPQLHFEIRKRRRAVDPLKYLGRRQAAEVERRYAMR